jgi:uroporphyrin-III C-methyltransferase/precorrin-2 dehydrogenase/sirohydrochlorin ferrochelatase
MYPVMLDLSGRRCLVVGGGGVALGKVQGLLAEGARVRVVAIAPVPALVELAAAGALEIERRAYQASDLDECALVFAATDDREVNRHVFADARARGIWANVADDPELCAFHLPARVRRGAFQLAIASAGGAPFVVRRLRKLLERRLGPEWAEWTEAAVRFRRFVRATGLPRDEMEKRYDQFFAATVDGKRLTARVPTSKEEAAWLRGQTGECSGNLAGTDVAHDRPELALTGKGTVGSVSLVGAGPGDAGLLTLRGRQRLLAADAVVYDRLAASALPTDLRPQVQLRCVGKEAGNHPVPQEEINALLVCLAREGNRVVRLKGGDPYVFGRGGEEVEALVAAGIPFEVIPGVTSAVGALAYAGIPITHRGEAVRITMITAHESKKGDGPQVRWDLLAADQHATLVGYMGVTHLPEVAGRLLACGMDPSMPAALIERGTTSRQRVVRSHLSRLADAARTARIEPPALFVIGPTVHRAETLAWFSRRPLSGERIAILAPTGSLADALELAGAEAVEVPLPLTPAARIVLGTAPLTGFVLKSRDEVDALEADQDGPGFATQIVAWCLRPEAAERARQLGWQHVEEVAEGGNLAEVISTIQARRQAGLAGARLQT